MKHQFEDEYVSYNVHLAPILGYEAPWSQPEGIDKKQLLRSNPRVNIA
jgi:hypothetical protein